MSLEIERKWLLTGLPEEGKAAPVRNLFTTYISIQLDKDGNIVQEIRVRRDNGTHEEYWRAADDETNMHWPDKITVKSGGEMVRSEIETQLPDDSFFEHIVFSTHEIPIHKEFRSWIKNDYRIEFSVVDGDYCYAEVEFENEEDAKNFVWPYPEVLVKETTDDPSFKMGNYWLRTRHRKGASIVEE